MRVNREMLARYRSIFPEPDFEIAADAIPCDVQMREDELFPVTLITEAPDETIQGEDFRIAQETQFRVVMAVANALSGDSLSA